MKIILLANNIVGLEIAKFLINEKENIVALGIHEIIKQKFTLEIIKTVGLNRNRIFLANQLRDESIVKKFRKLKPDFIIAAFWGYILKKELISIPLNGVINFHPGYLPYNRGMNPNVWPFIENTPAGVSLHFIEEGVDTGDIIARKKVNIESVDTAGTVYDKTLSEIISLFKKYWPKIKTRNYRKLSQKNLKDIPTSHRLKDLESLDHIDLNKTYTGREMINLLRARSYSDRYYAYYLEKGKQVFVRVNLSYENTVK